VTKKICKNCKHWRYSGECYCRKFKYNGNIKNINNSDELVYWDSECYKAAFKTGGNFGCIHFEERDEKESSDTV